MPIKHVGPKSLQKEEWNEYRTATNKKGMFHIESKKQNDQLCTANWDSLLCKTILRCPFLSRQVKETKLLIFSWATPTGLEAM